MVGRILALKSGDIPVVIDGYRLYLDHKSVVIAVDQAVNLAYRCGRIIFYGALILRACGIKFVAVLGYRVSVKLK